jgi:outer membrane receptor protein involved in Fe transport
MKTKQLQQAIVAATLGLGAALSNAAQLEEIMVTAQKRVQSVQDIPISISAVSGEAMENALVADIFDLRAVVPALEIRAVDPPSQGTSFAIRGLGTSVFNMGFEPTVATFIDGVYRSRSGLVSGSDLVDMARVEVLKGPQGTLFGKNSTGGVVSFYTNPPVMDETSGEVQLGYEEYNTVRANAILNIPLADGVAAARIVASIANGDGWVDNKVNGNEIHDRDRWNIRAQLLFEPTEDLNIRLIGDYAELDEACCTPLRNENDPRTGAVNRPLAESIGSTIIDPADLDDLDVALNADPSLDAEDKGLSADINWELGGMTLTSISAWREYEDEGYKDNDFTGVDVLLSDQSLPEVSLLSQELRLAGTLEDLFQGLDWTIGAYYADEKIELINNFYWGQQGVITSNAQAYGARFKQNGETMAVFAHGIFNLTERLSLTAGLRYTEDEKDGKLVNDHPLVPVPFPPFEIPAVFPLPVVHDYDTDTDDSATTGTVSLQYDWGEDVMTYVGYSTGFKSGGISMTRDAAGPFLGFTPEGPIGPFPAVDPTFDKEEAESIEAGIKSTLLDGSMRLNAAAWYTTFDDLQVQVLNPEGNFAVTNVEGAESYGVEVDGDYIANDYLTFNASIQWVDATYDDDVGGLTTPIPIGGERLPFVSDWTGSVGFVFDAPLSDGLHGFISGNIFARTDYLADPDPALDREQDGYEQYNLRAGVRSADDNWDLAVWCRNCTDERVVTSQFQIPFDGAIFFPHSTTWSHVGAPRIVGLTGTYRF